MGALINEMYAGKSGKSSKSSRSHHRGRRARLSPEKLAELVSEAEEQAVDYDEYAGYNITTVRLASNLAFEENLISGPKLHNGPPHHRFPTVLDQ